MSLLQTTQRKSQCRSKEITWVEVHWLETRWTKASHKGLKAWFIGLHIEVWAVFTTSTTCLIAGGQVIEHYRMQFWSLWYLYDGKDKVLKDKQRSLRSLSKVLLRAMKGLLYD
jgi:hypothetical protein